MREDQDSQREDYNSYTQQAQQNQGQSQPQVQPNSATSGGSNGGGQDWQTMFQNQANWTPENINAYAKSRGYDNPGFSNYWMQEGNNLYDRAKQLNDPNYAFTRLSLADEFTPPDQRYGGAGGGAAGGAGYVPGKGVPGMGTVFGAGGPIGTGAGNDLYNFLLQRMHQSEAPDPNDPIIRNQVDAFRANATRGARDQMTMAAERQAGTPTNNNAVERSMNEKAAQATSGYEAQLMGQERQNRMQQIEHALTGAMGFLSDSQRMQLQEELAQLQLGQGAYQFDTNMQFMNSPLYGGG